MTMKERLAMFEKNAKGGNDVGRATKVTVIDEGNIKEMHDRAKMRNTVPVKGNQEQADDLKKSKTMEFKPPFGEEEEKQEETKQAFSHLKVNDQNKP